MNEISPQIVNVQEIVPVKKSLNFKAGGIALSQTDYDAFIKHQDQERKNAKKKEAIYYSFLSVMTIATLATLGFMAKQYGLFKKYKLPFKDLTKELGLNEIALPESQKNAANRITNRIENYDEIIKKGGKKGSAILFYGPPGTGKNTFAYAITKKFPNAKFVELDISKMNSKWYGESEQNILGTMEAIIKHADKNPKEKIFVFIDEIDSVMMQDLGSNSKHSNDVLNAFKKGFNQLTNKENIVVMGATNLKINPELAQMEGKVLDSAMLDRFSQKVLVDLPNKEQIKEAAKLFYQKSERTMLDSSVKNINDPRWDKIAEFLSKEERQTSFRKLTSILNYAAEESPKGQNVVFDDIIKAIQENRNDLNISESEMKAFINSIK